jgi:hypothetical protein
MFRTKSRIEIAGRLNRVWFVAADAVFIVAVLNMYPNTQIENRPVSLLNKKSGHVKNRFFLP